MKRGKMAEILIGHIDSFIRVCNYNRKLNVLLEYIGLG